ncbi:MAG TPA: AzlC family ABC transporter permease [Solirubrobacterales bacterium]|nr:AzlC family ABC transporter permease [Solirubrobacterales bacterium]
MPPVTGIDRTVATIALAVLAFGISFGVLARAAGLDAAQAIAMSAIVFAGSAQFAAVAALDGGASALSAALAGIALNSRYLPLGIVVGRSLGGGAARRAFDAHLVIDESVALATDEAARVDEPRFRTVGLTLLTGWLAGTTAGALGAGLIGDPADLGLDAAFPALFLALIWPRLRVERGARRAALAGAALAGIGVIVLPVGLGVVVATAGAAAAWQAGGRPHPATAPDPAEEAGP